MFDDDLPFDPKVHGHDIASGIISHALVASISTYMQLTLQLILDNDWPAEHICT